MIKTIYISALVLSFLFLSSCGKKENTDEIKLPFDTQQVAKKVVKKNPPKQSEKSGKSKKSADILITAKLISDNDIIPKNISAEIKNSNLSIASSTNYSNGRIIFPPIKKGLTNLRVLVKADNIAETYSEYFGTCDGTNKTIDVNLLPSVKLYGKAVRADGTPITNIFVKATPRGLYENSRIGHVDRKIVTDADGNFVINKLLPEHYRLIVCADDLDSITTNIVLYYDEENRYEFIFPKIEYQTIKGIVKYEKTDEPAWDIEIKCETWGRKNIMTTVKTESDGKFDALLPSLKRKTTVLKINEPGYAKVERRIFDYKGEYIVLFLKETGIITGKITDENGSPISGLNVKFLPIDKQDEDYNIRETYSAYNKTPSNEQGIYIISNAAAPEVYKLELCSGRKDYRSIKKEFRKKKVSVIPGKTVFFDFQLTKSPQLKLKILDKNNDIISRYKLKVEAKTDSYSIQSNNDIVVRDENGWYYTDIYVDSKKATLTISVKTADAKNIVTNGILIKAGESYEIVLKDGEVKPDIAGFVYNYDMTPVIDSLISVTAKSKYSNFQTDYLGYFEIIGMNLKKATPVELLIWKDRISYTTNVLYGNDNIEWILSKPRNITGKVFIEDLSNPATNFTIAILNEGEKKYVHSDDGSFSVPMQYPNWDKTFKVYIFISGYSVVEKKVNPENINSYNLGDIIVEIKAATISGKIVDQNNNPVRINVALMKGFYKEILKTKSKISDGSYEFSDATPGKYYIMAHNHFTYVKSDNFKVMPGENYILPNLIINVPETTISGKVYLDGNLLNSARLVFCSRKNNNNTKVKNGKFDVKLIPGKYAVTCPKNKVAAIVNFQEATENIINFKSGTSVFDIEFPFQSEWYIIFERRIDNITILTASISVRNDKSQEVDKIQAGEYIITAYCSENNIKTNITVEATMKSGETKKIRF